jgi:hypothetical protein
MSILSRLGALAKQPVAWIVLFMLSPLLASACALAVGSAIGSRHVQEMAAVFWLAFYTIPFGLVLLLLFGVVSVFASYANRKGKGQPPPAPVVQSKAPLSTGANEQSGKPHGICPNCQSRVPVTSPECGKCGALFGQGSAWSVAPLASASKNDA